jgi:xanthine dehydrogenase YagR molybdenum-binding subunit
MTTTVGMSIDRIDGRLKVTGTAAYAADVRPPRLAYATVVQSTIARGRILSIETNTARGAPGVIAVLTHENTPPLRAPSSGSGTLGENRLPLSDPVVNYAGQHVAVVVAETFEQAAYAASLVNVRYHEERPLLQPEEAESTAIYPKEFNGLEVQHRRGDVDAALGSPGIVKIEQTYTMPVETHNPMEPSATVAEWTGDRLTVRDATQWVMGVRGVLADVFGIPKENVRALCPFTGGAFGGKGSQWPHMMLAAVAARATGRPVKLVLTRAQMFTSSGHRPATVQSLTLAGNRQGQLAAIRHSTVQPTSPTKDWFTPPGAATSAVLYACPNVETPLKLVRVNVSTPTFMRAPAQTPGTFALESAMDELAYALEIDPLELRLRNYADANPADGKPWSGKHLKECYTMGAERFGWKRRTAAPRSMQDRGLLLGWGMATATYPAHRNAASAAVELRADGTALVSVATHELGTGSYTVFTQVAADALGLPLQRVTFQLGDTDFPYARASGGSTTAASVSEAVVAAAAAAKAKLVALAISAPGSPLAGLSPAEVVTGDGRMVASWAPSRSVRYAEVLRRAGDGSIKVTASASPDEATEKAFAFQSFGAHFCEVQIDPALPRVQVTRVVSVMDVGRILNLKTARSQVLGGVTMGIGMALMEETAYDPRTGRPVTDNLADYRVPVNADIEAIEVHFIDQVDPHINAVGCRGLGEIGITGVAAAVANAVYHATGRRVRRLPITPDKLL